MATAVVADFLAKFYFMLVHLFLFLLGAFIIRTKAEIKLNSSKIIEQTSHLSSKGHVLTTQVQNINDVEKNEEEGGRHDDAINYLLTWIYQSHENYIRLILSNWIGHLQAELNSALSILSDSGKNGSKIKIVQSFDEFPFQISDIHHQPSNENEQVFKLVIKIKELCLVSTDATSYCVTGIKLNTNVSFARHAGHVVAALKVKGKKCISDLQVIPNECVGQTVLEGLKKVLSKTTSIKVDESAVSKSKHQKVKDDPKPSLISNQKDQLDSSIKDTPFVQPVTPIQRVSSTATKKVLVSGVQKHNSFDRIPRSLSLDNSVNSERNFKIFANPNIYKRDGRRSSSQSSRVSSDLTDVSELWDVKENLNLANHDSAFDEQKHFKPVGDFEAIQGSLDRTFSEDPLFNDESFNKSYNGLPVGRSKYGSISSYEFEDSNDVVLRHPSGEVKRPLRKRENRHSFHHGSRPKLVFSTPIDDTSSISSLRSSASYCSLNSAIGSLHNKYSALIIECEENQQKRYYHIPPAMAKKETYTQKGQKLHVYNNHIFVAMHFTGNLPQCFVCHLPLRKLGKQGYTCRDCNITTHKRCHYMVPTACPSSSLSSLNIVYVGGTDV